MVIYYKVLKRIGKPLVMIFAPKMMGKPPLLGLDPSQTWSWTQGSLVASKTSTFKLLDTSIAINTSSKQWTFHVRKCPKFVDSVFHHIWFRPKDLATLAWNLKIFCDMLSFRKKSLCAHTPWAHAENECEKSLMGPGGSKKSRNQFFLASFWRPFRPPFRPPNHNFFTYS